MTREHKLALIFGFALVLVVGLLISDNFSASRKAEPGGPSTAEADQPIMREDVLVANGNTGNPTITGAPVDGVVPGALAPYQNPSAGAPLPPNQVAATNEPGIDDQPSTFTTIGERVQTAWNDTIEDLSNGHTSTPPAAGMELARTPGTLSAAPGPGPNANPANPAAPQVGLQSPAQPLSTPERAPFDSNGTGGAGNDTSSLGVKPSDLNTGPEASIPPAPVPVASGEASPRNSDRRHQIAEGDSFWKLSSKYYNDGTLADALKAYNQDRIGKNGQLRIGASLLIPEKSALTSGKPATASEPKAASKAAAKPESRPEPRPAKSDLKVPNRDAIAKAGDSGRKASRPNTYTVRKGDTLEKIAVKFLGSASRVDDLMAANPGVLSDEDDLKAGAVLKIPAR